MRGYNNCTTVNEFSSGFSMFDPLLSGTIPSHPPRWATSLIFFLAIFFFFLFFWTLVFTTRTEAADTLDVSAQSHTITLSICPVYSRPCSVYGMVSIIEIELGPPIYQQDSLGHCTDRTLYTTYTERAHMIITHDVNIVRPAVADAVLRPKRFPTPALPVCVIIIIIVVIA